LFAEQGELAAVGLQPGRQQTQQRGLACAGRTDDSDAFALCGLDIDPRQRRLPAGVGMAHAGQAERRVRFDGAPVILYRGSGEGAHPRTGSGIT